MTVAGIVKKQAAKPMTNKILRSALREARYAKAGRKRDDSVKLADRLERAGLRSAAARALTIGLRRCRREHRCFSPECPQCAKAEQALLACATGKFTSDRADETNIVFATIIPPNASVPLGSLHEFDLGQFQAAGPRRLGENVGDMGSRRRRSHLERTPRRRVRSALVPTRSRDDRDRPHQ
jgi:hypothetical protein